jgi:MerR family transcriptional regulator, light-induced transcriptional regulator
MSDRERTPKDPSTGRGRADLWPMGAVTKRTGIGEHTLRAWERRFGFPRPHRLPSGHRRYTPEQVERLLMIQDALRAGYRAGDVVPLQPQRLEELLRAAGRPISTLADTPSEWVEEILRESLRFDRQAVEAHLLQAAATTGARRFLTDYVAPLLTVVGEAWERGDLAVRHEHFLSEVLEDVLRGLRDALEPGASGRPVVLATLPGERHVLGLHLAALVTAAAGRTVRMLGPDTPIAEITETAVAVNAAAVGLSISLHQAGEAANEAVVRLRGLLPPAVPLWLGGGGAPRLEQVPATTQVMDSLEDLDLGLRSLV